MSEGPRCYRIVRMYFDDRPTRVIKSHVTKAEAQRHCKDPETSSSTAKRPAEPGRWFDGLEEIPGCEPHDE